MWLRAAGGTRRGGRGLARWRPEVARAKLMRSPRRMPQTVVCRNTDSTRFQRSGGTTREPFASARIRFASRPCGARSAIARRMSLWRRRYAEARRGAGLAAPDAAGRVTKSLRPGEPGERASGMSISMSSGAGYSGVGCPSHSTGSPTPASAWSDTPGRRRSMLDGGSRCAVAVHGGVHGSPGSAGGAETGEVGRYGAEAGWVRGGDGGVDPEGG